MYKRYYSGYEDSDEIQSVDEIVGDCDESALASDVSDVSVASFPSFPSVDSIGTQKVFGNFAIDDIILIGVFLFLLEEECDDKLMLIVIGFILVMGFVG